MLRNYTYVKVMGTAQCVQNEAKVSSNGSNDSNLRRRDWVLHKDRRTFHTSVLRHVTVAIPHLPIPHFQMTRSAGNPHNRESRILAPVRPRIQAAGLQCLLQLLLSRPPNRHNSWSGVFPENPVTNALSLPVGTLLGEKALELSSFGRIDSGFAG